MKVNFSGFWPNFKGNENPLFVALQSNFEGISIVDNSLEADVVYYSIFAEDYSFFTNNKINFLYIGESKQYISKMFLENYSKLIKNVHLIGPEFINLKAKSNFRLTEWMWQIKWDSRIGDNNLITFKEITKKRYNFLREDKCCFISRYGAHPWLSDRIKYVEKIENNFKEVDKYGFEKPLDSGYRNKINVQKKYLYHLAFENNVSEGYVTEKLLHALVSGGVVLYYGHKDAKKDFNPEAFIQFDDENSFNNALEKLQLIKSSKREINKLFKTPIFLSLPNLSNFIDYTYKTIKNIKINN